MSAEGFNYDNPLIRMMNRIGDTVILSLCFVIGCLPIITIGNSITATYYAAMKSLSRDDGYIVKYYWKSYKENIKKNIPLWLMSAVALFVLGVDVWFWYRQVVQLGSLIMKSMLVVSIVMFACAFFTVSYVFPLQAKFENKITIQIRNAFLLSIKYFPTTMLMTLGVAIVLFLFKFQPGISFVGFVMVGFGILFYWFGSMMAKCFKPYLPEERSIEDTEFHIADEDENEEQEETQDEEQEQEEDSSVEPEDEEETEVEETSEEQ